MTVERRMYTEEFKREAVRLMESSGKPIAELARDLGINDNNLYRWRGLYGSQAQTNTNGSVTEMAVSLSRCCLHLIRRRRFRMTALARIGWGWII